MGVHVGAPERGPGGHVEMGHLLFVDVVPDSGVVRRAERVEEGEDLLLLDQPARVLDRPGRLVGVVQGDELDLAPVDASVGVFQLESHLRALGDRPVGRSGPAERVAAAELDRVLGDTGIASTLAALLVVTPAGREGQRQERHQPDDPSATSHSSPPRCSIKSFPPGAVLPASRRSHRGVPISPCARRASLPVSSTAPPPRWAGPT